ncbi:MAG TPA: hypothetical protein VGR84_19215 [Candidatus Acidoferrales bacterium]|nr:hypothetical protein [Candidatus Acidoferrales bacterium]
MLKKWWPSIAPIAGLVFAQFVPQVQQGISAHPQVASVLAVVYAIFAHIMPSPTAPPAK